MWNESFFSAPQLKRDPLGARGTTWPSGMECFEIARKRKVLGQSVEQLADDLGVPAATVREWEVGNRTVPSKYARQIDWFFAAAEREAALAQSGLPACEWASRWEAGGPLPDSDQELERLRAFETHHDQCPTCQARAGYLKDRLPSLPPLPISWWERAVGPIFDLYDNLRGWRRAVAVALCVPLLLSLGWALRAAPRSWPFEIVTYFVALAVAAASGIGLYHGLRPLHGLGAIGRWIARSIAGVIAMVGFGAVFTLANFGSVLSRDGVAPSWSGVIWMGVTIGVLYATFWPLASAIHRK